ncbi:MAG TPA: hypothetical protein VGT07_16875, partial [Steroidobacteraceae bacterium]|nr:hypothetical protein [Steroidobacteraceae bacterium]
RLIYHLLSKMRDHCREHNITGVALVPVWTATTWFQEIAVEAEIRFLPDLLSFGEHQNSFPTPLCTLTFTGMSHLLRQQNLKMFDFGLRKPAKRVQVNDLYCTAI